VTDEIALFIDFENIRYSLINVQHREPDPQELIGVARRFGTVMVARAYADWSRQPEFFKGSLTAAMIDRVDCPAKVRERFRQNPMAPYYNNQGPYNPFQPRGAQPLAEDEDETYDEDNQEITDDERDAEAVEDVELEERSELSDEQEDEESAALEESDEDEETGERRGRNDPPYGYANGAGFHHSGQQVITQSTVDLNMLMDIIETVFDRPSINTFVLMSGDRDFTRICARLKLRLNKRVIVVGVPGTVSRDLISAAEQFVPLGQAGGYYGDRHGGYRYPSHQQPLPYAAAAGPVEPEEPGFIQFLDYIDRHWSWRTIGGIANFIGDPFNSKNRFRGRLTRDSARDLLRTCVDDGILIPTLDNTGNENLRLNREHPAVATVLSESVVD
jgi:uncharacterized LabA/DUF88 family protein